MSRRNIGRGHELIKCWGFTGYSEPTLNTRAFTCEFTWSAVVFAE
jgi:hypothetical protein